jgi:hypothetical protein
MNTEAKAPPAPAIKTAAFPRWLLGIGFLSMLGSAVLATRLIWEMTVLSWERGVQMVGFALVHSSNAWLVLCPLVLILWLVASVAIVLWRLWKRKRLSRLSLVAIGLSIVLLGIMHLSYGFWLWLFIDRWAGGPFVPGFFTTAAATGDLTLVKALVERGTPVDLRDNHGATPLHAAAVGGHVGVIRYLLAAGADVNAVNWSDNSPLQNAISEHHPEAAKVLAEHGGKNIRHGEEQRQ